MKKLSTLLAFILFSFVTSGCQIPYLLKNSWHQTKILKSREPIEDVLKDPQISESVKQKLQLVQKARTFSIENLGLVASDNYTTYVDLKRNYVTWVVRAAPKHKLEPHQWWFPITGHVPYKGYFTKSGAEDEAESLKAHNLDTYVRGVTAYSTLGWFEDPVLNTMLSYDDYDLVNLIIHETVHATLFIKSQVDFNERLATFIGNKGAELYFKNSPHGDEILKSAKLENQDLAVFSKFITSELNQLKEWYASESQDKVLIERERKFQEIKTRFAEQIVPQLKTQRFHYFEKITINNAVLLSYETYQANLDLFEQLYAKLNQNFKALIQFCKTLEKVEDPEGEIQRFIGATN